MLRCVRDLGRGRVAFMTAVRDYNQEIAEYALAVAYEGMSRESVVGMLIKPRQASPTAPLPTDGTEEVAPATFENAQPTMPERPDAIQLGRFIDILADILQS